MTSWLIIGGFVLMLMAPCLAAFIVGRIGKWQREGLVNEFGVPVDAIPTTTDDRPVGVTKEVESPGTPIIPVAAKAAETAEFGIMRNLSSGEIQTVRVVWSKQFDSEEYPRAGGRIRRRI